MHTHNEESQQDLEGNLKFIEELLQEDVNKPPSGQVHRKVTQKPKSIELPNNASHLRLQQQGHQFHGQHAKAQSLFQFGSQQTEQLRYQPLYFNEIPETNEENLNKSAQSLQ